MTMNLHGCAEALARRPAPRPCRASPCRRARAPRPRIRTPCRAPAPSRPGTADCRRCPAGCRDPCASAMPSAMACPRRIARFMIPASGLPRTAARWLRVPRLLPCVPVSGAIAGRQGRSKWYAPSASNRAGMLDAPRERAAGHVDVGQRDRCVAARRQSASALRSALERIAGTPGRRTGRGAEADQQHAVGRDAREHRSSGSEAPGFSPRSPRLVTRRDLSLDGLVDLLGGGGERAVGKGADNESPGPVPSPARELRTVSSNASRARDGRSCARGCASDSQTHAQSVCRHVAFLARLAHRSEPPRQAQEVPGREQDGHTTKSATTYGSISAITVPTPASFWYFWRRHDQREVRVQWRDTALRGESPTR